MIIETKYPHDLLSVAGIWDLLAYKNQCIKFQE